MKLHIDTAPVWEAYRTDCECPLCLLKDWVEAASVEYFLGESVMEPSQRIEVNEKGFCGRYFKLMFDAGNRLGLALMTDTYMKRTIEKLAETLSISETAVKRHLKTLSDCGLIERKRPKRNGPSQILLNLPAGSIKAGCTAQERARQGAKTGCHTGRKVSGNNRRKRIDWNDYYEREDDESL